MPVYSVNYDLQSPGQSYEDRYEEIKNRGAWWHYLVYATIRPQP